MNLTKSLIAIIALALCAPALLGQTSISADIDTDTTWNNAGSPYEINTGGDFYVLSDATLTIDTTSGNVDVDWLDGATFDFIVTEGATLVIKAASGSVTFGMTSASNIRITSTGRITWLDDTGSTTFTRLNSDNEPGALIFEADQSRQSDIKNAVFSYMGNDGRDGAIVVEDNGALPPLLEGLSFSDCTTSAIRFDGKGINTLRQDGLKPPFSVTNTDYMFFLNAVTSTVPIRFPDPSAPASPFAMLAGTCEVGDGSNVSHWRFDTAYTFHCATSSEIEVIRGSIWGTAESKPTFRHPNPTTGTPGWVGLKDEQTATANVFGGMAAFAHLKVRDAVTGIRLVKGNAYVGQSARLHGIAVQHCNNGIQAIANSGTLTISSCEVGGSSATEECFSSCIRVSSDVNAVFHVKDCQILGAKPSSGVGLWTTFWPTCVIEDCQFSGNGAAAVQANNGSNVTIRDTLIAGSWSYGVYAFATTSGHTQLLVERSSIGGIVKGMELVTAATGKVSARVLNSTLIGSTNAGVVINAGSTLHGIEFERCIFSDCGYAVHLVDDSDNLVTPEFIECQFTSNSYGIYDARTHASHAVAYHCSFLGNSTYGAFDAEGSEELIAQDCYWGHPDGPTEPFGPTLGDEVNQYVDVQPPLSVPYINWWSGGLVAGVSAFSVWNDATTPAEQLHVVATDNRPYFLWEFASQFPGATQSAYEIAVSRFPTFATFRWQSGKISGSSSSVQYPDSGVDALLDGTLYYARIRLWSDSDLLGPWYHTIFRINTPPPKVNNIARLPIEFAAHNDWTPTLQWVRPLDADGDPLHFEVHMEDASTTDVYILRSWDESEHINNSSQVASINARECFEYSPDLGITWLPFPSHGAPGGFTSSGFPVRLIWPDAFALHDTPGAWVDMWSWKVRASDGFEFGAWSDSWDLQMQREYVIGGILYNGNGSAIDGVNLRLYINGTDSGETDTTNGNLQLGAIGTFAIKTTAPLKRGDVLWVYMDNNTSISEKAASILLFPGHSIQYWDVDSPGVVLRYNRVRVGGFSDGLRIQNADFTVTDADADIPWSLSGSDEVIFSSDIAGAGEGVHVFGDWDLTGAVNSGSSQGVELHIPSEGCARAWGQSMTFAVVLNAGELQLRDGSTLNLDANGSVTSGIFELHDASLAFSGSESLSLTVDRGIMLLKDAEVKHVGSAGPTSRINVEPASGQVDAVLDCKGTTFHRVSLVVAEEGILTAFDGNRFEDDGSQVVAGTATDCTPMDVADSSANWTVGEFAGMTLRMGASTGTYKYYHIIWNFTTQIVVEAGESLTSDGWGASSSYAVLQGTPATYLKWSSTRPQGAAVLSGNRFDGASGGHNVRASGDARPILMSSSSGAMAGPTWERDPGDKVSWEAFPPRGLQLEPGDERIRAEWEPSEQIAVAGQGFNLYASPILDGNWTSSPSYSSGTGRTTFTNSNASFFSGMVGVEFYPDVSATTKLEIVAVPSATTVEVAGDHESAADIDVRYSFFVKVNASLLSSTTEIAADLANNTTYYFYVTVDDATEDPPATRVRSAMRSAMPREAEIDELAPESAPATSVLALTVIGEYTHWTASVSAAITKDGGEGVTVHDKLVISETLVIVDATLVSASSGTWTVTLTEEDVWAVSGYDEVTTAGLLVTEDPTDESGRPTLVFSTNNGGIGHDEDTNDSFLLNLDFTDNGGGVDTQSILIYASRVADFGGGPISPGEDLFAELSVFVLDESQALFEVASGAFANGETTVFASIADNSGHRSAWASIRFYVQGGDEEVVKVSGGGAGLLQGTTVTVQLTGTGLSSSNPIDFGAGIVVNWASGSGSSISVNVTVDHLAACGPREISTNSGAKTGVVLVEYPTNLLPTPTNPEPPQNAAVAGVNVLLANGSFFHGRTDLATSGRVMGISHSRLYRSDLSTYNGPLGHGWLGRNFQRVVLSGNDIHWYTPDGRKEVFAFSGGVYSNPAGVYVRAERDAVHGVITLMDRYGSACQFNEDGRLWRCIDRNGNAVEYEYNYLGQLVGIVDDRGKEWEVLYYDHGRVHKILDKVWSAGNPREVEYVYSNAGDLVQQRAPETSRYNATNGNRTTYGYRYDDQHRLIACISPREFNESSEPVAFLENVYDAQGRVTDQRLGEDADVKDSHVPKSSWIRLRYVSSTLVREVDRAGLRTDYTIDNSKRLEELKSFTGFWAVDIEPPIDHSTVTQIAAKVRDSDPSSFVSSFTYNAHHEVLTATSPKGNGVSYTYPSGSVETSGSATSCAGAVLNDTTKSWTEDWTGMILRMGTGPSSFRYYPIASNTATSITVAAGFDLQADGWNDHDYAVLADSGDPMAAGNVLTVTRDDGATGTIETDYTYEPRYQLLKTATDPDGNTTTYTYDYEVSTANDAGRGLLIKTESPVVTGSMPAGAITTYTTYNEFGQTVATVDGMGNITRFLYYSTGDNKGFLKQRVSAWNELDLRSEFEYNAAGYLTASWPPRAFDPGATKDDFKTSYSVNELGQTWHTVGPKVSDGSSARPRRYSYFDANGNLTHSLAEYITANNGAAPAPGDEDDPSTFSRSGSAMAATWHLTRYRYNLLDYAYEVETDAVAGGSIATTTSRTEFDSNYNGIISISPMGNKSHTVLDERNLTYQRIGGVDSEAVGVYESDYDANGNLLVSRDARGNETSYEYDGFDRLRACLRSRFQSSDHQVYHRKVYECFA